MCCRLQEALADFEQAVALEPNNALSHNARGLLLEKMGRPDAALADFEKAVQLDNGANIDFLRNRGLCFRARKEYNKAVDDFDRYSKSLHKLLSLWQCCNQEALSSSVTMQGWRCKAMSRYAFGQCRVAQVTSCLHELKRLPLLSAMQHAFLDDAILPSCMSATV